MLLRLFWTAVYSTHKQKGLYTMVSCAAASYPSESSDVAVQHRLLHLEPGRDLSDWTMRLIFNEQPAKAKNTQVCKKLVRREGVTDK